MLGMCCKSEQTKLTGKWLPTVQRLQIQTGVLVDNETGVFGIFRYRYRYGNNSEFNKQCHCVVPML